MAKGETENTAARNRSKRETARPGDNDERGEWYQTMAQKEEKRKYLQVKPANTMGGVSPHDHALSEKAGKTHGYWDKMTTRSTRVPRETRGRTATRERKLTRRVVTTHAPRRKKGKIKNEDSKKRTTKQSVKGTPREGQCGGNGRTEGGTPPVLRR